MARDWHELFRTWAKPPSESEEAKASRAAQMIRDALRGDTALASRDFIVYPTGSYRNNTNIRLGSDVDVAVVFRGAFFYEIPPGRSPAEFGLGQSASYGLEDFRAEVSRALVAKFGAGVQARAKTFTILGNSSRLPADATPFLPHRMYTGRRRPDGAWEYQEGVETRPTTEPARRIINWHQEHFTSTFGITRSGGRTAHTACLGFGLERVTLALIKAHGFQPDRWPAAVREQLWP